MDGHLEDSSDTQPFLDDDPLAEQNNKLLKYRSKVPGTNFRAMLAILGAHLLGWMLAFSIPSRIGESSLGSGDDINQIIPPSTLMCPHSFEHIRLRETEANPINSQNKTGRI